MTASNRFTFTIYEFVLWFYSPDKLLVLYYSPNTLFAWFLRVQNDESLNISGSTDKHNLSADKHHLSIDEANIRQPMNYFLIKFFFFALAISIDLSLRPSLSLSLFRMSVRNDETTSWLAFYRPTHIYYITFPCLFLLFLSSFTCKNWLFNEGHPRTTENFQKYLTTFIRLQSR